jgi:hypothetical protein
LNINVRLLNYPTTALKMASSLETKMGEACLDDETSHQRTPFGKEMLKHFLFDPGFRNLNHGSSPISALSAMANTILQARLVQPHE